MLDHILVAGPAVAVYEIGDTVSDFVLDDCYGLSHSLYDFEGKIFLLNFFATW